MVQIFYKISNSNIHFCSTSYESKNSHKDYSISYNEGIIGEINNFDYFSTEDYSELENFMSEIKLKYPDELKNKTKIRITLIVDGDLKKLSYERFNDLLVHFMNTACFSATASGLGDFFDVNLNNFKNQYFLDLEVIDKNLFYKVFIDLISPSGLRESDFILS